MGVQDHRTMGIALPRTPLTARRARQAVQTFLGDDAPIPLIRDAILLTSELVTNVMMHTGAGGEMSLVFDRADQTVRVEVTDTSPDVPHIDPASPTTRPGGHGLRMVDELATRWGSMPNGTGKTIWFELGR